MANVGAFTLLVASSGVPSGTPASQAVGVVWGPASPRRLVVYVKHDNSCNVTLYRWSEAYQDWVPNNGGVKAVTANALKELVFETDGIDGAYYAMGASGGTTGTWQPLPGVAGP